MPAQLIMEMRLRLRHCREPLIKDPFGIHERFALVRVGRQVVVRSDTVGGRECILGRHGSEHFQSRTITLIALIPVFGTLQHGGAQQHRLDIVL